MHRALLKKQKLVRDI